MGVQLFINKEFKGKKKKTPQEETKILNLFYAEKKEIKNEKKSGIKISNSNESGKRE